MSGLTEVCGIREARGMVYAAPAKPGPYQVRAGAESDLALPDGADFGGLIEFEESVHGLLEFTSECKAGASGRANRKGRRP